MPLADASSSEVTGSGDNVHRDNPWARSARWGRSFHTRSPGTGMAGLEERVGARCPKPSTAECKTAA